MCGQEHNFLKTTVSEELGGGERRGWGQGLHLRGPVGASTRCGVWPRRGVGASLSLSHAQPSWSPSEPVPSQAEDRCVLRPGARHTELENPGPRVHLQELTF